MKQFFKITVVLGASLLLLSSAVFAAGSTNSASQKTPWKITGQLEEACTCDAACPCWFDSKPTKMSCGGGQVVFIEKGNPDQRKALGEIGMPLSPPAASSKTSVQVPPITRKVKGQEPSIAVGG